VEFGFFGLGPKILGPECGVPMGTVLLYLYFNIIDPTIQSKFRDIICWPYGSGAPTCTSKIFGFGHQNGTPKIKFYALLFLSNF
jgi:hypothetical protein